MGDYRVASTVEGTSRVRWEYLGRGLYCDAGAGEVKNGKRVRTHLVSVSAGRRCFGCPMLDSRQRAFHVMVSYPPDKEAHGARLRFI